MHNLGYARLRKKLENMVNNTITSQRQEKSSICQVISQNKELKNPPWFMLPKHMKYHISVPVLTYQDMSLYTGSCKNTTTSQRQEKKFFYMTCHFTEQRGKKFTMVYASQTYGISFIGSCIDLSRSIM